MLREGVTGTIILLFLSSALHGQAPVIQWQRSLGGYNGDYPQSVQQTSDGGYISAGYTLGTDGGDVEGYHGTVGLGDLWVTKLSASGALQWERCYGGIDQEANAYIRQTSDGGYVLAGSTASSGCGMPTNHGGLDYWLLKLSPTGDIQWQSLLGGSGNEYVTSLNPTPDGGYIIGGSTSSSDGQVTGYHPGGVYNFDWWIVKVDGTGNLIWEKTLGGSGNDQCIGVALTPDGGCIATGWESSTDGDVTGNHGNQDAWMVKLDGTGNLQWEKAYGGSNPDGGNAVLSTADGGYIFSGFTASNNGDVSGNHQSGGSAAEDLWVVKTDAAGAIQWQKCYGGSDNEEGWAMAATASGGYVLTGQAESTDGDLSCNAGIDDVWLLQIDGSGNLQWSKTMGGSYFDIGYAVQQLGDGSIVVAAETCSVEVPGYHYSATNSTCGDYWIIKLSAPGVAPSPAVTITPASGVVCANATATFTAVVQNAGGVTQSYAWTKNGVAVGGNSSMYTASNFNEGDVLTVAVNPGAGVCDVSGGWITASQTVHINPNTLHPTVQISSGTTLLCNCAPAQFTVKVTGGGTEPAYQWMIDGVIQGTNSESFLSASLLPTDVVSCQYFDSSGCVVNAPVVSNSISLTPGTGAPVSVSISGPTDSLCVGSPDTLTASAVNAGANPTYQWEVNGGDVGSNSSIYTSSGLANGDIVTCIVTADPAFTCSSGGPANSNPVTVALAAKGNPSVIMTVSPDTLCIGDTAVFKATAQQAGANPTFAWSVDGVANGVTGPVFEGQNFSNGDVVQCAVTVDPNYTCSLTNTANSAPITLDVLNQPDPTIVIAGSPNAVCAGVQIEFNAAGQNAGVDPSYQWMVNGQPVGANGPTFGSSTLSNGDVVTCRMTPGAGACMVSGIVSGPVVADVEPLPVVHVSPADTVLLSGGQVTLQGEIVGIVASYQWTPANLLTDPQSLTPETVPLQDSVQFTLTVQSTQGCVGTAAAKVLIYRALAMPNAFTPNGDGINDVFRIPPGVTLQLTEMDVYDRWGMRVFSTRNIGQGWDGTVGGRPAPAGAYVYVITGSDLKGPVSAKGTVLLVR